MARRGFSLVEMLVVLAITALVLSLLATAYVMELRGIRSAKGLLEMDNDLRAAEQQIRTLLRQRHFEGDLRVSEIDPNDPNRQPKAGFFAVIEGGPERLPPGVTSQPEIYVKDGLNFTVRLVGNSPTDFFETSLVQPPNWTASRQSGFNFAGLQPPTWLQLNGGYPESRYQPLATSPTLERFPQSVGRDCDLPQPPARSR
jgi:prepilin-type N-terminal cleavage/methylation domain-containing protein